MDQIVDTLSSKAMKKCIVKIIKYQKKFQKAKSDEKKMKYSKKILKKIMSCKSLFDFGEIQEPDASKNSLSNFFKDGSPLRIKVFKKYIWGGEYNKMKEENEGEDHPVIAESSENNEIEIVSYYSSDDEEIIGKGKIPINTNE